MAARDNCQVRTGHPLPRRNVFLALLYRSVALVGFAWLLAVSWFKWWASIPLAVIVVMATLALAVTVMAVLRADRLGNDEPTRRGAQ
jgi:hypothetical protein